MALHSRRSFIRSVTAMAFPVLSGCAGIPETMTPSERTQKPTTRKFTPEPTQSPTIEETTDRRPSRTDYSFGEWFEEGALRYTVDDIELLPSFSTDDGTERSMPSDEQLLLATARVKNTDTDQYERLWGGRFVAIVNGEHYQDTYRIRLASGEKIDVDELTMVEHIRRWGPEGYKVDPGKTVTSWFSFVVPRNTVRDEVEIAFNWETNQDDTYPVRWSTD